MPDTPRRRVWATRAAAALVLCVAAASATLVSARSPGSFLQQPTSPESPLQQSLADGFRKIEAGQFEEARAIFERAIELAKADGDVGSEAEAYRGLGRARSSTLAFAEGRAAYERALALFEQAGDLRGVGRVWNHLATDAFNQNRLDEARRGYDLALDAFRRAGLPGDEANILRNSIFLPDRSIDEKLQLVAVAVDRARAGGARITEGLALHTWGDLLFTQNRYAAAKAKLDEALAVLETSGSSRDLARLYTSLGRLYRIHGDPAHALTYYERALERQRAVSDRLGEIQSLNASALALSVLGRNREANSRYAEALDQARKSGSPAQLRFILQQCGIFDLTLHRYTRAAARLEEALTLDPPLAERARALSSLGTAYNALGRREAAAAAMDRAVALARESGDADALRNVYFARSQQALAAGRTQPALDDARESLRIGERLRPDLLPADLMKVGFAERFRRHFDFAISLMVNAGLAEEAFVVGERGRARAFLDLLASRELEGSDAERSDEGNPELESLIATEAPSIDRLRETAARLGSTVISYWVAPETTFVWVLSPDGRVRGRQIQVSARHLSDLVRSTWALPSPRLTTRGDQDRLTTGESSPSFRELYDTLVTPVRAWLPRGDGASLLTIVPHGALLRLSFAALRNERGKYLVEGYRLHYAPSLSTLQFTMRKNVADRRDRLLLVANPSPPAAVRRADRLPPLPGARREAQAIARVSQGAAVRILSEADAREARIRADAGNWTTLHFAAHAVVSDDRPLASYLALAGSSTDAADDGRLTVREIYRLALRSDLVVLSACRTASGRITGDGIVGLTRAFIYAGAPSVVASVWDLADETTPRMFESFYAARARGAEPSTALRAAQLEILGALRTGSVFVTTAAGRFAVPEHPSIWSGLQLWGEP